MRFTTCAFVAALSVSSLAQGGLVTLAGDLIGVNAIETIPGQPGQPDSWSMRIYAVLENPDDTLQSVYGTGDVPIFISTSAMFYQNTFGGPTSLDIDPGEYEALPDLAYDSWITIGADSMFDNDLDVSGTSFVAFNAGNPLYAPAGTWSVTDGAAQASPMLMDGQWRVLLGQFSIIGQLTSTLTVQLNLSGNDADGGSWTQGGSWTFNGVPGPGALPLAAVVLCSRRRRRA
ncbi:MAG: hypothetical protein MK101_06825 [Phycisphaerales bacterium]|nr:hypothetical protein [Phycisphaerales bacterium]